MIRTPPSRSSRHAVSQLNSYLRRASLGHQRLSHLPHLWVRVSLLTREGGERMGRYVLGLEEIDRTQVAVTGGKGAHPGELSRIEGVRVPAGFCVTTDAFRRIMAEAPSIDGRLDRLSRLKPDDRAAIRA